MLHRCKAMQPVVMPTPKIMKIQSNVDCQSCIYWTNSGTNIADCLTRTNQSLNVVNSKFFQNCGPMTISRKKWLVFRPNDTENINKNVKLSDYIPDYLLCPKPSRQIIQLAPSKLKWADFDKNPVEDDQKLLEDDSYLIEGDQSPGVIGLNPKLDLKNSYLRRTNLNVDGLEVWAKLLDSHALDKCLRILTLASHACKMIIYKLTLAQSLERLPQVSNNIRRFLGKQASKVSTLYLQKTNFY